MEFSFPEKYWAPISNILQKNGYALESSEKLARAVLKLSDHYIEKQGEPTPWSDSTTLAAYAAYFFPLNYVRVSSAIFEGQRLGFFSNIDSVVDFGSGPGTATFALRDHISQIKSFHCIENSREAYQIYERLTPDRTTTWSDRFDIKKILKRSGTLLVFSYSLLEIAEMPEGWDQFDQLLIVEPSDKKAGRALLETRNHLIEKGYTIWAPCTHQQRCPLIDSRTDWCHHRLRWNKPQWFSSLEQKLPIKNNTLTFSYLLASRTPPPTNLRQYSRLTGDLKKEKGKWRQLVCRNSEREFLAWLTKEGTPNEFHRGDLVKLSENSTKISNEIRAKANEIVALGESDLILDNPK